MLKIKNIQGLNKCYQPFWLILFSIFIFTAEIVQAQKPPPLIVKDAIEANRQKLYRNLINNSITKNLSLPLTDSTEENWMNAFDALQLIRYKSPWADARINIAFDAAEKRSIGFQQSLLELAYTNYPNIFAPQIKKILEQAPNGKLWVTAAAYLANIEAYKKELNPCLNKAFKNGKMQEADSLYIQLFVQKFIKNNGCKIEKRLIDSLLSKNYLPGNVVLFSFQRKNRDYPGLVIVRDTLGYFVKDQYNSIFSVSQLARSITNQQGYLTNGNTPQGIFRIDGFAVSRSNFIGPTPNIQLTMPWETSLQHFLKDSTIIDSVWTEDWYKKLLPNGWKNCPSLFETYFAGKLGRTEIIAHGTTINPAYYKSQPYYPLTPSLGCLCTKEIWSGGDGKCLQSDQQKLADAVTKAGGANGYCIVIELDDEQRPVTLDDLLKYLQ